MSADMLTRHLPLSCECCMPTLRIQLQWVVHSGAAAHALRLPNPHPNLHLTAPPCLAGRNDQRAPGYI